MGRVEYVSLWAVLPALKNREIAKRYLANAEKFLGRPLNSKEKAYLEDVIRQGDHVEEFLRQLGYFDKGPGVSCSGSMECQLKPIRKLRKY